MNSLHDPDLPAAYVLDALDDAERIAFEAHLVECEECQAEVAELRPIVGVLPLAVPEIEPSIELKDRILEVVEAEAAHGGLEVLRGGSDRPSRRLPWVWEVIGGLAAAAAIVGLGLWNSQLRNTVDSQSKTAAYNAQITKALAQGARVMPLKATAPGRNVTAAMVQPANGGKSYLVVGSMPRTPAGKVYELWFIRGATPVPATVFTHSGSDPQVVPVPMRAGTYNVAAITIERGPKGSAKPTTQPMIAGKLGA